jgi:hypothetical protein
LPRKDINLLMGKVEVDEDGLVHYNEFLPLCFGVLVERFADQVSSSNAMSSDDSMLSYILSCFKEFDVEGVLLSVHVDTKKQE